MEMKRKRTIVQPRTDPGVVGRDVNEAIGTLHRNEERMRQDARETVNPTKRPDLNQDVTGGIQSRNLNRVR
jgi:hypothetical protein